MVCGFFAHALRLDDVVPVDLRVRKTKSLRMSYGTARRSSNTPHLGSIPCGMAWPRGRGLAAEVGWSWRRTTRVGATDD